ncbi:hypothetical protein AHIS1636_35690 [Arthrobacter mangrovi]|uniref:DUF4440 domain-containing protein n=1 Tax=Arthrobacter mangrovi TaxID=2966350 RepID=A0ABQ5MYQ4_9MICC|nr:hypothetical protein AHIS1636_35690 [Arthrobacter mangrovi]
MNGDTEGFALLCHPNLIFLHATGETETRESYLSKLEAGRYTYNRVEHPIHSITVADGTAVVMGDVIAELNAEGKTIRLQNRVLATWVQTNQGWLLVGHAGLPLDNRRR